MARSLYLNVSLGKNTNNSGQFSEYITFEQAGAEVCHTRGCQFGHCLKELFIISLEFIDSLSFYPINGYFWGQGRVQKLFCCLLM